ncbi:MAG: hypothetical protein KUG78_08475 [Kangiellaceae bacterium]|nr:hypothetical protein [Kangiellaceae bacterium]
MSETYDSSDIQVIDLSKMSMAKVIGEIEKRPLCWLAEKHIRYLDTFITGYLIGKQCRSDSAEMTDFNRYVENKYKITTTHGWARNINHMSTDPHSALDMFFELFKECKNSVQN